MKAWVVTIKDSDEFEFVLAKTRGKAKYYSDATSWGDWTELRVRRIPELDGIEHPTDWDWYSRVKNWTYNFTCPECGDSVDMDDEKFVFDEGGWIYHESCQQKAESDWDQICKEFAHFMQQSHGVDEMSIVAMREITEGL